MSPRVMPYHLGADTVIEDDVSRYGLHQRHIIRIGAMPDVDANLQSLPRTVHFWRCWVWLGEDHRGRLIGHQVIAWKEKLP